MKVKARRQRQQSLAAPLALVLAVVCVVQLHLLLRPKNRGPDVAAAGDEDRPIFIDLSDEPDRPARRQTRQLDQGRRDEEAAEASTAAGAALVTSPRVQKPADPVASGLARIHGAPLAFVSFANGAFNEFLENWVMSVQRLGVPFVVGALDDRMAATAAARGWPHLLVGAAGGGSKDGSFFRANLTAFRSMGAKKVQLVLSLLEDMQVETVVVSDSDTAWVRDPSEYLDRFPTADFFISTDCLSHETEAAWKPDHNQPRCGHVAGSTWGRSFNTGVFAVRNRPGGRLILEKWRDAMSASAASTFKVIERATGLERDMGITDQMAINRMLDVEGPIPATPDNPRVLLCLNGALRVHPLPVLYFPSGHVAFVQRLPWRHGVDPYVVHATFQRFPTDLHREGKRGRFREMGLWHLDDSRPGYYDVANGTASSGTANTDSGTTTTSSSSSTLGNTGKYITYTNDVRRVVAEVAAGPRFQGVMPLMYKHMVAVSYQLALFRDVLAASVMLNRTLVLPRSWCWCDYDWTPHVLEKCRIRGSDLPQPFECPADFVFVIPFMDREKINYRMPGFLSHPKVPEHVRRWQAQLHVLPARPQGVLPAAGAAGEAAAANSVLEAGPKSAGLLWPGMAESEFRAAVQPLAEASVLRVSNMQPGLLTGFADPQAGTAFQATWTKVTSEHLYWCCAAELAAWSSFVYQLPEPYDGQYRPWEAPTIPLPTWCDDIAANPRQQEYVLYDNHPCSFLTNKTSARIAAAIA